MVWSENQYLRTPTDVTSDQVYLRMVGDREITQFKEVQKDKSTEMRTWYKELEESSDSVKGALVFFNNHYAGFGPGSVNEFPVSPDSWSTPSRRRVAPRRARRASGTSASLET